MAHRLLTEDPEALDALDLIWALEESGRRCTTWDAEDPAYPRYRAVFQEVRRRLDSSPIQPKHIVSDTEDCWCEPEVVKVAGK